MYSSISFCLRDFKNIDLHESTTILCRQFSVDNSPPTIHRRKIHRRKIHCLKIHCRKIHHSKIHRRNIHRRKIHCIDLSRSYVEKH